MEDDKYYRVEILEGSNYSVWRWQIESVLKAKKLYEVVVPPADKKDGFDADKDNQVYALIAASLSRSNKLKVISSKTPRELWQRLESIYENKTSFEMQSLLGKLHNYRIKSTSELSEAISDIQNIVAKLDILGEKVSENVVMNIILRALPPFYKQFLVSWKLLNEQDRNMNNLISNIMSMADDDNSRGDDQALFAKRDNRAGRGNKGRGGANKWPPKDVVCHYCKKKGHIMKDCFKKKREEGDRETALRSSMDKRNPQRNRNSMKNKNTSKRYVSFMAKDTGKTVDSQWIVDSGSTCHMTSNMDWIRNYREFDQEKSIRLGDDYTIKAIGTGIIETTVGKLTNVLYVPDITENLFSLMAATKNGIKGTFDNDAIIFEFDGDEIIRGCSNDGVYTLTLDIVMEEERAMAATLEEWHERFGHVSKDTLVRMADLNVVDGLKIASSSTGMCEDCALGKCKKASHPTKSTPLATRAAMTLHFDTAGPMGIESKAGQKYFLLCKDEYSSYRMVKFLPDKSQIPTAVKLLISVAETETNNKVLNIMTDNGSEFVNKDLKEFLDSRGINHKTSAPYVPQQNGRIEREIRTVVESARTMLNKSKLSKDLWAEAVNTAVYVLNRTLKSNTNRVPYELWFGRVPRVDNLLKFGQPVCVRIPDAKRRHFTKFDNKGMVMYVVGYGDSFNTYRLLDPESKHVMLGCDVIPLKEKVKHHDIKQHDKNNNKILEIMDSMDEGHKAANSSLDASGIFSVSSVCPFDRFDEEFGTPEIRNRDSEVTRINRAGSDAGLQRSSGNQIRITEARSDSDIESDGPALTATSDQSEDEGDTTELLASQPSTSTPKTHRRSTSFGDTLRRNIPTNLFIQKKAPEITETRLRKRDDATPSKYHAKLSLLESETDPNSYKEAMEREDRELWHMAMEEEIESLKKNKVWKLVKRPKGNVVTNKWVLKIKRKPDGSIDRYKARLVARGFSQIPGIDFHETYAPVANMVSIRLLLAYVAVEKLELAMFDVKTAFLYGKLDETIYMEQPEGFEDYGDKVCLLQKSLYGLKQAPRQWNKEFKTFLESLDLKISKNDECIFFREKPLLIIAIYVDDGIIIARERNVIDITLELLRQKFEIHSVETDSYLGFQIYRGTKDKITIHQSSYIKKILKKYDMENGKAVDTPTILTPSKDTEPEKLADTIPYREAIGSLMYAAVITRLDIAYAVGLASRKVADPTEADWTAVKRIFRYLRDKEDLGITYDHNKDKGFIVYCDADFAGDVETSRSTTGLVIMYGGAPIHWKSQRQTLITLSSTEAEYVSMCTTVKETLWLRRLAIELGILDDSPIPILCDNESAIKIASNEKSSKRTRHMSVQAAYPRERMEDGEITINHVKTDYQLADMLTKPTSTKKFWKNRNQLMSNILKMISCIFVVFVGLTMAIEFERIEPVIWVPTPHYVEGGVQHYAIDLVFRSPCTIIPTHTEHHFDLPPANDSLMMAEAKMAMTSRADCDNLYNKLMFDEVGAMQHIVPMNHPLEKRKKKRSIIGMALLVLGIVVTNIVSTIFTPSADSDLERARIVHSVEATNALEERFKTAFNHSKQVEYGVIEELKRLHMQIDRNEAHFQHLMTTLPHFTWTSAYIQMKMATFIEDIRKLKSEYRMGRVATAEMARILNMTQLEDIPNEDTKFDSWHVYESGFRLKFRIEKKMTETSIYSLVGMKFWGNLTGKPVLYDYNGPQYILYNQTNDCIKGIHTPIQRAVLDSCHTDGMRESSLRMWRAVPTSGISMEDMEPQIIRSNMVSYIYCYPHNITIYGVLHGCPAHAFKLSSGISFTIGSESYEAVNTSFSTKGYMDEAIPSPKGGQYHTTGLENNELDFLKRIHELQRIVDSNNPEFGQLFIIKDFGRDWKPIVGVLGLTVILLIYYIYRITCRNRKQPRHVNVRKRTIEALGSTEGLDMVELKKLRKNAKLKVRKGSENSLSFPPPPGIGDYSSIPSHSSTGAC